MKWVCVVIMWSLKTIIGKSYSSSISYAKSNLKLPDKFRRGAFRKRWCHVIHVIWLLWPSSLKWKSKMMGDCCVFNFFFFFFFSGFAWNHRFQIQQAWTLLQSLCRVWPRVRHATLKSLQFFTQIKRLLRRSSTIEARSFALIGHQVRIAVLFKNSFFGKVILFGFIRALRVWVSKTQCRVAILVVCSAYF